MDRPQLSIADKFRITCELRELGIEIMRQRFRRENPSASEADVDELLRRWIEDRPGARYGDVAGPGLKVTVFENGRRRSWSLEPE